MASKVLWFSLTAVLLPLATSAADDNVTKLLLQQFSAMESRLSYLEKENVKLQAEIDDLKNEKGSHVSRRQLGGSVTGFSAKISSHLSGLGSRHTVVFDSVISNYGNAYDNMTGYFKAPEPGVYAFFANIMSEAGNGNEYIETEIVKNGNQIAEMYSGGSTYFDSTSNMAVVSLEEGDHVWVRVHGGWSSNFAIHCCFSTFSGFLLGYYEDTSVIAVG